MAEQPPPRGCVLKPSASGVKRKIEREQPPPRGCVLKLARYYI